MFTGYLRFLYLGKNPYTLARGDEDYSSGITSSRSIYFGYSTETRVYVSGCGKYNDSYLRISVACVGEHCDKRYWLQWVISNWGKTCTQVM